MIVDIENAQRFNLAFDVSCFFKLKSLPLNCIKIYMEVCLANRYQSGKGFVIDIFRRRVINEMCLAVKTELIYYF